MRIVFYPAQGGKVWNGQTLYHEGLGGSETAVVYLARELAKKGHEVVVFTRATPGIYDDVAYVAWEKARNILRTLPCDALICARDPLPLLWARQAAVSVFWAHDLPSGTQPLPAASAYWFVSAFQRDLYVHYGVTPKERSHVVPNGVDLSLFKNGNKQIGPLDRDSDVTLAWTSNPERGLWYAGEVLQRVRKHYPKAELHVWGRNTVYGWDGACEHNYYPDDMHGVILHQPLPKHELAYALATQANLWVYPTWWPETYCIAAVEAQAAGVPVVASGYAALTETAKAGVLVPGYVGMDGHLDGIVEATLGLLASPEQRALHRTQGWAYAQTQSWETSANAAVSFISRLLGVQAT